MSTCRWCTPGGSASTELLKSYAAKELRSDDLLGADDDLSFCMECVLEYHRVRDEAPQLHKALWNMERSRIATQLEKAMQEEIDEDDELFLVEEDGEKQLFGYTGPNFESSVRVPLLEILKYPYLLLDKHIGELCIGALCKMEHVNNPFQVYEKLPGIYLLLVHPNESIRRWAILTARAQGKVDRDDYYDLQEVFTCLFKVIELGLFENPDIYSYTELEDGKLILLPAHLYDTSNYKNYWLGVCMLLTVLEEEAMDSLLLGPDKENDFMQSILTVMEKQTDDESTNPFWPALHCFMMILDRLGSKIWGQLIDPIQAFQTIINSPSYTHEIESIRRSCQRVAKNELDPDDGDDLVSCSQIVYNFNTEKPKKDTGWKSAICPDYCPNMYEDMQSLANILQSDIGQEMRVHNSTFLWFIPYVQSVMDLKDLGIAYIMEVIHHLYSEIKDVLNPRNFSCDKVSELFIRVLVSVIELHRNKKCLHLLWVSSHKWVEVLVKGSMIPTKDMVARPNSKITSTTALSSSPNSQVPSSVQFSCIQLIRSLLREGFQLGQNNCKQYMDKLNLVIRGNVLWNPEFKSEVQGLQSCLTQIIKSIKDRTSTIPSSVTEQTTISKVQSVPFIKTERIDEDDEWYGRSSRSPLPSPDIPFASTSRSSEIGFRSGSPSPDTHPLRAGRPSEQKGEGLFFQVKKEPQDVQTKSPTFGSSYPAVLKTSIKKEPVDETVQENVHCSKKTKGLWSKLSEVLTKSSVGKEKINPSVSEGNISSSTDTSSALKPCYVRIKKEQDLSQKEKSRPFGSDTDEESDGDDIPLSQVRSSLCGKEKCSTPDNLPVSEQLQRLSLENDLRPIKKEPNGKVECNDFVMESEADDELSLSEVKKKLLLNMGKKLGPSNPTGDQDLGRSAAQEVTPSQDFSSIARKVKGSTRSLVTDDSSSETEFSSDPIITISDDSSDEEQKDFLKFVKTEKPQSCQAASSSSSAKLMQTKIAQIKQEPDIENLDDLDSQCFEFETKDDIYSAWTDSQLEEQKMDLPKKCEKSETDQIRNRDFYYASNYDQWGYDTDYICDDVIEKAAEDAEKQFQESLKATNAQTRGESSGDISSHEKMSSKQFYGKIPRETETKTNKFDSKRKLSKTTKETFRVEIKLKADSSVKQNKVVNSKPSRSKSPLKAHGHVRKIGSPGKAVVPPKKIRKCPEPTSTAEKLGLKKPPRKAFDLSQRSLDSVTELRNYGKAAGVVETKRQKAKLISPQAILVKGNKKMLTCQERQFHRQSRPKDAEKKRPSNTEKRSRPSENSNKPVRKTRDGASFVQSRHDKNERLIDPLRKTESPKRSPLPSTSSVPETMRDDDSNGLPRTTMAQPPSSVPADIIQSSTEPELDDYEDEDDDRLFLTQADPLDMDLCSQVDSEIVQDNRPLIVGEQSAPIQEVKKTLQCKHPDCSETVSAPGHQCPKHSTSEKTDDHLFVRPGLPPSFQKPSKPATTKVFSTESASRTASLTKDLENTPKYPTLPKAKVQLPKPPLPKLIMPQKKAPVQTTSGVLQPLSNLNNVPVPPASNSGPASTGRFPVPVCLPQMDQAWLMREVLHWTYEMFENFQQFGPPSNLCPLPLMKVPLNFSSYDEYFKVFFPLMLQNAFESLAQEWRDKRRVQGAHPYNLYLQNFCLDSQVNRGEFQARIRDKDLNFQRHPKEDDLVFLLTPESPDVHSREERDAPSSPAFHMGHVFRFTRSQNTQNYEHEQYTLCNLCIHTRGNLSAFRNGHVQCVIIGSFITTLRQYKALLQLQRNMLFRSFVHPNPTDFMPNNNAENNPISSILNLKEYNSGQIVAIEKAFAMVTQPPRVPKICLIHGPPGTGKSKTIVGLLYRILMEKRNSNVPVQNFNAKNKRNRVLVCAPSNAALDDLMKKIILEFKEKCNDKKNTLGNCGDINLVRLGAEKTIDSDVVKFSLDCQVNYRISRAQQDHGIYRRKEELDRKLDQLSRQKAMERCNKQTCEQLDQQMDQLSKERQHLANTLRELRRRPQEVQRNIILESHVICCTLSTSGGLLLESAFRQLGQEPFSCVIVDEAGQSCEVETIIPLLHRCTKLVLVGDPEQLPPTVISTKAEDLGYGQSLMARLYRYLEAKGHGSLIQQLRVQYRMHPDICLFPSNYFYNRALKTDRATEEVRCSSDWPFQPYIVFDVADGLEKKEKESFANPQEVKMVVALVKLIKSKKKEFTFRNIGIITPYRAQKMLIIEELRKEFGKDSRPSEVDTVDGFQGRQKDCIIVTCVRANSGQGSIGFLASRQRLNVTITRARFSLFILGSLRTLMENKDWNHLIQDAKRRGSLFQTKEGHYQKDVGRILKRPSVSQSGWPPGERHTAGSPSHTSPAEAPPREHTLPPQPVVQPPKRIVSHPAVDIRPMLNRTASAPVTSSVARAKLQDPRLARRQGEEARDANPSRSEAQKQSTGYVQSRSRTHFSSSSSSSVAGVKRPSHSSSWDRPPHSEQRANDFTRDRDYRQVTSRLDPDQEAKKRKIT
ncbi:probable helicase senataxin [Hyla sarda]|uniref:probable helicase senataxin n=1 Tax=Hyla sarda TaxID=327740 RepID=UPI0024C3876E|nr:probable helicase senataxin [Hyla sarda]XP_056394369.1 probable helicase senataxin [Hyla sarda]